MVEIADETDQLAEALDVEGVEVDLVAAAGGVRHRRAAVALGRSPELGFLVDRAAVFSTARHLLDDRERWLPEMGRLVLENTVFDVTAAQEPDDVPDFE